MINKFNPHYIHFLNSFKFKYKKFKFLFVKTNCTAIVPFSGNVNSGIGGPTILSKNIAKMYSFSYCQLSVLIGLMLGYGSIRIQKSKRSINGHFYYKQSLKHFTYF